MNIIKNLFKRIAKNQNSYYKVTYSYDIPDEISEKVVHIIGGKEKEWTLLFKCPCGCEEPIFLNLLQDAKPRWKYKIRSKRLSIVPSIWRKSGCRSHFYIKHSKVVWIENDRSCVFLPNL